MVHGVHLFVLSIEAQADLEPALAQKNGANMYQCSVLWGDFLWARGSECHRV
jgi:hypothetical protein